MEKNSTTMSQLVARSRKLGADRSDCNWGGGNTSAKVEEIDFRGRPAAVLRVKGSGSDFGSLQILQNRDWTVETCRDCPYAFDNEGVFLHIVLPVAQRPFQHT